MPCINGKDLSARLGVTPQSLSEAARKGHLCGGHNVAAWARKSPSGVITGYDVPDSMWKELQPVESAQRPNPVPKAESVVPTTHTETTTMSLLPPGVDYFRPVASASAGHVLAAAVQHDTPQSRAIMLIGGAALGAVIGHQVSKGDGLAVLLGAGAGAYLAALGLGIVPVAQPGMAAPPMRSSPSEALAALSRAGVARSPKALDGASVGSNFAEHRGSVRGGGTTKLDELLVRAQREISAGRFAKLD